MSKSNIDKLIELGDLIKDEKHVLSHKYFEDEVKELDKARAKSEKLYRSLKMSNDTFTREFDL